MLLHRNKLFGIQEVSFEYVKAEELLQIKFFFVVVLFTFNSNRIIIYIYYSIVYTMRFKHV